MAMIVGRTVFTLDPQANETEANMSWFMTSSIFIQLCVLLSYYVRKLKLKKKNHTTIKVFAGLKASICKIKYSE